MVGVLAGLALGLAFLVLRRGPGTDGRVRDADAASAAARRGRWAPVLLGLAAVVLVQGELLGRVPHVADEMTYLFESRLLLGGAARAPAPDPALVLRSRVPFTTLLDGAWVGAFLPGWPLVLAGASVLGSPWLAGPVLFLVNLWLLRRWARRHLGPEVGEACALLGALSPFLWMQHASLMADALAWGLGLGALLAWEEERPAVCGAAAVGALLTRPASLFFLGPALLAAGVLRRPARWLWLGAGALPGLALVAAWNQATTGSPWSFAYEVAAPSTGFLAGAVRYQGHLLRHDTVAAATNLGINLHALNQDLLGWPWLSLLPVGAGVLAGGALRRGGALRWGVVGLVLGYGLYYLPGMAYGPRFYLPAVPWLLAAAALGLRALLDRWGLPFLAGVRVLWIATLPAIVGVYLPALALDLSRSAGIDGGPLRWAEERYAGRDRLLVLVPRVGTPATPLIFSFQAAVDPFFAGPRVYVEDPGNPARARRWGEVLGREVVRLPWPPPAGPRDGVRNAAEPPHVLAP